MRLINLLIVETDSNAYMLRDSSKNEVQKWSYGKHIDPQYTITEMRLLHCHFKANELVSNTYQFR